MQPDHAESSAATTGYLYALILMGRNKWIPVKYFRWGEVMAIFPQWNCKTQLLLCTLAEGYTLIHCTNKSLCAKARKHPKEGHESKSIDWRTDKYVLKNTGNWRSFSSEYTNTFPAQLNAQHCHTLKWWKSSKSKKEKQRFLLLPVSLNFVPFLSVN